VLGLFAAAGPEATAAAGQYGRDGAATCSIERIDSFNGCR